MDFNAQPMTDECVPQQTVIENVMLAQAYVPFQKLCETFTPQGALIHGTAFPPLTESIWWVRKGVKAIDDE